MQILNKKLYKKYNNNGWVKIENLLSRKDVSKINHKINEFIEKKFKKYSGRDINFTGNKKNEKKFINSFHKLADSSLIVGLAKRSYIKDIAEYFLQSKSLFMASELFAKPARYGLPVPIHQDNYYWCVKNSNALTIWIALDKVTKSNGGLCYYEKSHQAGLFKHMSSFAKGSSQKIAKNNVLNQFKKKFPNLYPGDALIHHCLTIHGSKRNKTSFSRRGLTLQFRDKNSAIDKILKRNYEKQLKFQIKQR